LRKGGYKLLFLFALKSNTTFFIKEKKEFVLESEAKNI
jgi:hypothetical protein